MAIYHCRASIVSRGSGRSAVAAASYRSGEALFDEQTQRMRDCRPDDSAAVEHVQLIGWTRSREELWNAVEAAEKRKDAQLAREIEIALPAELDHLQRIALAVDYAEELRKRYGVALDVALHEPSNGGTNYHAHILMTTREVTNNTLSPKKNRAMNSKEALENIRQLWQDVANTHLARARETARIDRRTLAEQGIDRVPTVHHYNEQHPLHTERKKQNEYILSLNRKIEIVAIKIEQTAREIKNGLAEKVAAGLDMWLHRRPVHAAAQTQERTQRTPPAPLTRAQMNKLERAVTTALGTWGRSTQPQPRAQTRAPIRTWTRAPLLELRAVLALPELLRRHCRRMSHWQKIRLNRIKTHWHKQTQTEVNDVSIRV